MNQALDQGSRLSFKDFERLSRFIHTNFGIKLPRSKHTMLQSRLSKRLRVLGMHDFSQYCDYVLCPEGMEAELVHMVDVVTTNKTEFFRERASLDRFVGLALPSLLREGKVGGTNRLRVWSAGCSTGEEPYTIAMLLMEKGFCDGWDVEIIGSDINQKVLSSARRGVYKRSSFRCTEEALVSKYFEEESPGSFKISDGVKKYVSFSYLNLFDPYKLSFLKDFDVIFCRNVIIYFDQASRKKLVETFYAKLASSGYLLLGHSESLLNLTTSFRLVHLKNDMVYQKPAIVPAASPAAGK